MEQSIQSTTIDERLDRLEALVSSLRDDLACVIERTREDFEDLNTELENRFQRFYDSQKRADQRFTEAVDQLGRTIDPDLNRIRYDVSCLEGRCSNLERGSRY